MKYERTVTGIFHSRPNRFIAWVEIDGTLEKCHVKNTGRCKELLIPGVKVILSVPDSPGRKTKYDLVAVYKGARLINMDSQAPNQAAGEFLNTLFPDILYKKAECSYGTSRFDFYFETPEEKGFLEVKGVTLEEDGVVRFPDAPTERGVKHVEELMRCLEEGYKAYILFVIQMKNVRYFTPNVRTHPAFSEVLQRAAEKGVKIFAYDCMVMEDSMTLSDPVEIRLTDDEVIR